jgi:hypothetical protein
LLECNSAVFSPEKVKLAAEVVGRVVVTASITQVHVYVCKNGIGRVPFLSECGISYLFALTGTSKERTIFTFLKMNRKDLRTCYGLSQVGIPKRLPVISPTSTKQGRN